MLNQTGYYCLEPATSRIYVSRHVHFVESVFPLANQAHEPQPLLVDYSPTWIPPTITIPRSSITLPVESSESLAIAPVNVESSEVSNPSGREHVTTSASTSTSTITR